MATKIPPRYRFTLADRTVAATRSVNPVWKDDLALEYEREQGQMFFRRKLNGKLTFVGADMEWILQRGYSHQIGVTMDRSDDNGVTWSEYWIGHFYMTDCEVNLDDSLITVQPTVDDEYNKVLDGYDKEFNLVELLPETDFVRMRKFPLIQIYYPGESTLSCIYNGMSWEQDVDQETSDDVLTNEYHFSRNSDKREISLKQNGVIYGVYEAEVTEDESEPYDISFYPISGGSGTYLQVTYTRTIQQDLPIYNIKIELRNDQTHAMLYSYEETGLGKKNTSDLTFTMTAEGSSATMEGATYTRAIYARILLDVEEFDGVETAPLSPADFCYDNRNYHRAIGFVLGARYLTVSAQTQVSPTEYGKASNGEYFVEPTASDDVYPIARTTWDNTSVWFVNDGNFIDFMRSVGTKTMTLRTAYPVWSVISVLLNAINAGVTHQGSAAYSQFLYDATNPLTGSQNRTLLMSPKSNVLAGEFSQPAMKAPVTLKNIMEMLRDVYGCYWHIDNGKFCIEHVHYYRQGCTYGSMTQGYYLPLIIARNGKSWGFGANRYSYEKERMPQTFQYGWMDDVTEAFTGRPVRMLSPYVDEGSTEEVTVSMFTSDVDFMMLNPQGMSRDGFVLLAGQASGSEYILPVITISSGRWPWVTKFLYLQNGDLAFCMLQPNYLTYDMPARNIEMNGQQTTAKAVRRTKVQEVRMPMYDDPRILEVVETDLGYGIIEKMSIKLTSRIAKTTLKYEPE